MACCCGNNDAEACGWPPNTIRAAIAIASSVLSLGVFGFLAVYLAIQREYTMMMGIVGIITTTLSGIISFYFGSKTGQANAAAAVQQVQLQRLAHLEEGLVHEAEAARAFSAASAAAAATASAAASLPARDTAMRDARDIRDVREQHERGGRGRHREGREGREGKDARDVRCGGSPRGTERCAERCVDCDRDGRGEHSPRGCERFVMNDRLVDRAAASVGDRSPSSVAGSRAADENTVSSAHDGLHDAIA